MTTLVLSLFAGCASHTPPKADEARVKQFSGRGYLSDDRFSIITTQASWAIGEYSFDIVMSAPVAGRDLPVVIYLPGLGEDRTAGESWRTAWAKAGYAVLAVQPLAEDRKAWSSEAARRGDFVALARQRYAKEAEALRIKALAALFAEVGKRRAAGDPFLGRLDTAHLAIAGYDIGAYTAMLAAGEMPQGNPEPFPLPVPVAAVIALSPYADFSGSAFSTRYQSINGPVLSVTGDEDTDALGVVTSPSVRKAPFEHMPSTDGYLLWLANARHALMSGTPALAGEEAAKAVESSPREDGRNSRQGSREARRGGSMSGVGVERGSAGVGGAVSSPTDQAMSSALIEGVTTAFLDAYLKGDPIAREWLRKDAGRWIGERGELRRK